jgi:hypothetical protein
MDTTREVTSIEYKPGDLSSAGGIFMITCIHVLLGGDDLLEPAPDLVRPERGKAKPEVMGIIWN